jgi:L-ribulokinase
MTPPRKCRPAVIGVDFGTLSGRAVVVAVDDGTTLGSAVHEYAHGVLTETLPAKPDRDSAGPRDGESGAHRDGESGAHRDGESGGDRVRLPHDWALQVPADYVDVLRNAVPKALAASGVSADDVVGIGTDFTACTVLPTLADGTPLCELDEFRNRPHAYVKLWRHHAAQSQADRINALAHERREPWIARYGGKLSSEWELAKGLQLLEEDPEIYRRMDHWVEAADWIIWRLSGAYVRNICTAGYKAVYQDGRYPSRDFLGALDERFVDFFDAKVAQPLAELGDAAGGLTEEAARWTGLRPGTPVAVGNVDAHVTSPAAQAIEPGQMLMVMGTSTCHVMNSDTLAEVPGMCGVVRDGITPGLWGYEAGQSGVGDIFAWQVRNAVPADYAERAAAQGVDLHEYLTQQAARQQVGAHGLVALDWLSGNRSVLVDHELSGLVVGLTLSTRPEDIYRALLESTAFGTRKIIESFEASGVPVTELVVAGGLLKNRFLMQLYADVTRRPLSLLDSDQGPALGSAIHAAVAGGAYPDVHAASAAMGRKQTAAYLPDEARARAYDPLYAEYATLHDYFGRGGNDVMHRLRAVQRKAVSS